MAKFKKLAPIERKKTREYDRKRIEEMRAQMDEARERRYATAIRPPDPPKQVLAIVRTKEKPPVSKSKTILRGVFLMKGGALHTILSRTIYEGGRRRPVFWVVLAGLYLLILGMVVLVLLSIVIILLEG